MKKYIMFTSIIILTIAVLFVCLLHKSQIVSFQEIETDTIEYKGKGSGIKYSNNDVYKIIKS